MSPTPRCAFALGACALAGLIVPVWIAAFAAAGVLVAAGVDAWFARSVPEFERSLPRLLWRGVPADLRLVPAGAAAGHTRIRQPGVPDVVIEPREGDESLDARVTARRRGRHVLPAPAVRSVGPLGLGCYYARRGESADLVVYPDMPAARGIARAVVRDRFREAGLRRAERLGLGTEFESIRDYLPDDDFRQINWAATARLDKPMSNQYRVEQDRDLVCLVDAGRLMAAPIAGATRLDAAVDAVAAVAVVADELGDRCGVIAFDDDVLREVRPRRRGARHVVDAVYDLEPTGDDADYELAFRKVQEGKRSFVLVLTDLLDEAAARSLIAAVPVLARRHAVAIASTADTDLERSVRRVPAVVEDVYEAAVATLVLESRQRAAARLRSAGAQVVQAVPGRLAAACVAAYVRAKARASL